VPPSSPPDSTARDNSIIHRIGGTPLVRLDGLNPNPGVELWAKVESFNPGGSVKDRPAKNMIEAAEADGRLTKSKVILEATSGNTGIGLALVAAARGYRLRLTMPESASIERRKILLAYGAELVLTPAHLSTDGAIEEAYRMAREEPEKFFLTDQFNNPDNPEAHYLTTGPEIWAETRGRITHFIATLGTAGTVMGCRRFFKSKNKAIRVVAVEPFFGHKIQGLKNMKESYRPGIFDKNLVDEIINIDDSVAFETARRLAREEGLFVGMSSGAAVAGAVRICQELDSGVVVTILPDGGERYLSTPLFEKKKAAHLTFYNTLARTKEPFEPLEPGRVRLYTGGPTVAGNLHLGNSRRYVVADLLKRVLSSKGYRVEQVVNITDLNDRTIHRARATGRSLADLTEAYTQEFLKDMEELRVSPAQAYPLASEHVDHMIDLTGRLLNKGYAYEKMRSVYFDLSRDPAYGTLSRVDLAKIRVGKTVDLDDYEKDNPRDFTLFKRSTLDELKEGLYWTSPWGNVRPSWHIECAAMAAAHLGERFDIFISAADLIFPHHENLAAIGRAAFGQNPAGYWLHNEAVTFRGHKISDSLGHITTLRDLFEWGFAGREVRYWLLATHYRKPLELSLRALKTAARTVRRLDGFARRLSRKSGCRTCAELDQLLYEARTRFNDALDDDLNTAGALSTLFKLVRKINGLMDRGLVSAGQRRKVLAQLKDWDGILDVIKIQEAGPDKEAEELLALRAAARQAGDYETADALRERLAGMGVPVRDSRRT
jgi:cysteinyl-tRNA synthetase